MNYYYYVDGIKNNKRYVSKRPIEISTDTLEEAVTTIKELVEKYKFLEEEFHYLGATATKRQYEQGVTENLNKSLELKIIKKDTTYVEYPLRHVDVLRYKDYKGTRRKINLSKNFKIVFMSPEELVTEDFVMFKLIGKDLKFVSFISEEEKEKLQEEIEVWEKSQKPNY